jgi:hypothetical protein
MNLKYERIITEAVGILLAIFGAVILFATILPIINPGLHHSTSGKTNPTVLGYITGEAVALIVLIGAWQLNRYARLLRNKEMDEKKGPQPPPPN